MMVRIRKRDAKGGVRGALLLGLRFPHGLSTGRRSLQVVPGSGQNKCDYFFRLSKRKKTYVTEIVA